MLNIKVGPSLHLLILSVLLLIFFLWNHAFRASFLDYDMIWNVV